ncbi:MAG: hypothetical protein R6V85_14890 [Polyangia bacterium]
MERLGPRPDSRLPPGVGQIETPSQALAKAREALERIDEEMAAAENEEQRAALERKRELVEQAIQRLSGE